MRIDEFSNAGEIDGEVSTAEQSRFLLFGFDLGYSFSNSYREEIIVNSPILLRTSLTGPVTIIQRVSSPLF